nr:uncharacterized protein LOC111423791 [Onthophagus taurus]
MVYNKVCFVPTCGNTSSNAPKKLFVTVSKKRRLRWINAVNITEKKAITRLKHCSMLYCCEDHFNLSEDVENWNYYLKVGKLLRLKNDVVPHLKLDGNEQNQESQFDDAMREEKLRFANDLQFFEEREIAKGDSNIERKIENKDNSIKKERIDKLESNFCFVSSGLSLKCLVDLGLVDKNTNCKSNNLDSHPNLTNYDPLTTENDINNIIKPELIIKSDE